MSAHVRLSTRLRNQTEFINTTDAAGAKGVWMDGLVVPLAVELESCWDICARRDWVVTLGSCCKFW